MNDKNDYPLESRMPLGEHFEELRRCLIRALLAAVVGLGVCLIFGDGIMRVMCWPVAVAMRYRDIPVRLRTLAPAEGFTTYLKVCGICGLIASAPYGLWQMWQFIAAGLYPRERHYVQRYVPLSIGLFIAGAGFFFLVIAPICLAFFLGFGQRHYPAPPWTSPILRQATDEPSPGETTRPAVVTVPVLDADPATPAEGQLWLRSGDNRLRLFRGGGVRVYEPAVESFLSAELTLGHYVTFVAWLSLVFGLGFQVPIVVLVLCGSQIVPLQRMRMMRKYVVLALLLVAALLTPPDIVSQVALAVPMYGLFELGLLLARRSESRRPQMD